MHLKLHILLFNFYFHLLYIFSCIFNINNWCKFVDNCACNPREQYYTVTRVELWSIREISSSWWIKNKNEKLSDILFTIKQTYKQIHTCHYYFRDKILFSVSLSSPWGIKNSGYETVEYFISISVHLKKIYIIKYEMRIFLFHIYHHLFLSLPIAIIKTIS